MKKLAKLFKSNREWAARINREHPDFFERLSNQQHPDYLWIGCSDSRVPANEIVGVLPGELFVHRNVANQVIHTDINCLSVIQFAVDQLEVEHIIVCGHYDCGGVKAAMDKAPQGLIDNWLRPLNSLYRKNRTDLLQIDSERQRANRMCELNVISQALNVALSTIVRNAWSRSQNLTVHGWIYDVRDGLLKDLEVTISSQEEADLLAEKWDQ